MCGLSIAVGPVARLSGDVFQEIVSIADGRPVVDLYVSGIGDVNLTFGGFKYEEGATAVGNQITEFYGFECTAEPGVE